jgi:hypothetical protein
MSILGFGISDLGLEEKKRTAPSAEAAATPPFQGGELQDFGLEETNPPFNKPALRSGEPCPEDADRKFRPNEEEGQENKCADGDSILDFLYRPQYQLTQEAGAEQQDTHNRKIEQLPVHFICEPHRHKRYEQYKRYGEHNADKSFVLKSDLHKSYYILLIILDG